MTNVLYIEDSVINARLMDRIFARHLPGVDLVIAPDGLSGLRMLESEQPALLLLDCHLPDISGLEVLKSARGIGNTVPVVVITADARADLEAQMTTAGAQCVITKPFLFKELLKQIRNFVPDASTPRSEESPRSDAR